MFLVSYLRNLCQIQGHKDFVLCFLPEVFFVVVLPEILQLKFLFLDSDPYWINFQISVRYMGFPGESDSKESACNLRELGPTPGSGRSRGEGNGYPL